MTRRFSTSSIFGIVLLASCNGCSSSTTTTDTGQPADSGPSATDGSTTTTDTGRPYDAGPLADTGPVDSGPLLPVTSVGVTPPGAMVQVGQSIQLTATARAANGTVVNGRLVTWRSADPTLATVDNAGLVTGVAEGPVVIEAVIDGQSGSTSVTVQRDPVVVVTDFQIDPSRAAQTMDGIEATAAVGEYDCPEWRTYRDQVVALGAQQGVRRVRLEVRSGAENTRDAWVEWQNGQLDRRQYRELSYMITNDNNDPNTTNLSGFHFTELDLKIREIVVPLRQQLQAQGESLYVNLCYVDFQSPAGTYDHFNSAAEYAEFMLVMFQHMQSTFGFVPDGIEVILEPDVAAGWASPNFVGDSIAATAMRLAAAGFNPEFIGPSNTDMAAAVTYYDAIINRSDVRPYLKELSYHRYSGVSDDTLRQIAQRGQRDGVRTAMLEWLYVARPDVFRDVQLGNNSVWSPYALAGCGPGNIDGTYFYADSSSGSPVSGITDRAIPASHVFRETDRGAVRFEVNGGRPGIADVLSFRNPDGTWVFVADDQAGAGFTIGGLPAGTYRMFYSGNGQKQAVMPPVSIAAGQALTVPPTAAPAMVTVYGE